MSLPDYYRILGVSRTAKPPEIKAAYRRLALRYHPDLHPDNPRAEEILKIINQAYDVLSDAQQRRQYDVQIAARPATPSYPARPATPTQPRNTRVYSSFATRPTPRFSDQTSNLHLKNVFLMWGLGLLIVLGFAAMFYREPPISSDSGPEQIKLSLRKPAQGLLFANSAGGVSSEEAYIQKDSLRTGEKMALQYNVHANQGRVFIGIKGQARGPGGAAPFADGEWIGRTGTGTIEVLIPRSDNYVIFLNLDNFAGTIEVNPTKE